MLNLFPDRGPSNAAEKATIILVSLLFFGALIWGLVDEYHPRKLAAVFFLLSWIVLIAIHELGHALMAWLCGWRVDQIVIGAGRPLIRFSWQNTPIEIRQLPIQGFVQTFPRNMSYPRAKDALIYAAGPGIELLLAYLILQVLGSDALFSRTDDYGLLAWQSFTLAAVVGAVINLIPLSTLAEDGHWIPNDGKGILLAFRKPLTEYYARAEAAGAGKG